MDTILRTVVKHIRTWLEPLLVALTDLLISFGYGAYLVAHGHSPRSLHSASDVAAYLSWEIVVILALCGILAAFQHKIWFARAEALLRLALAFPGLSAFAVLAFYQHRIDWLAFGFGGALAIESIYRWFLLSFWRLPLAEADKLAREELSR